MNENTEETRLDLLIKQAVYGLTEAEQQQLDDLEIHNKRVSDETFAQTAAAISLVAVDRKDEMPQALRSKILADAYELFDAKAQPETAATVGEPESVVYTLPAARRPFWDWLGWAVAAAACVALAINIWVTSFRPAPQVGYVTPTPTPEQRPGTEQMREQLIASAPDMMRVTLGAGNMKNMQPSGDIVWSNAKQQGYLRLTGLPKNDPGKQTYQVWIVADNQDPKTPVDGGVFDVNSDGEMVIPINPKVKALNPKAFAITIEKPGGVVVSTQEKVAALGKVET
ncbi:MAG TPA: anti-sigma factor [Pyrinomonadaceae bacterium]|nr:anti-sigma factor [Pyrinomonadaceae bacterium]